MKVKSATGPRTPRGKARSSQNAFKHGAYSRRILPEEVKLASKFEKAFTEELQIQGLLESEILGDLVVNRLQRRRIEATTTHEFEKAREHALETQKETIVSRQAQNYLRCAKYYSGDLLGYTDCSPPSLCVPFLGDLKDLIATDALNSDGVTRLMKFIYGEKFTPGGAVILLRYNQMKEAQDEPASEEQQAKVREHRKSLLEATNEEIERQKAMIKYENMEEKEVIESSSDMQVIPLAESLDQIQRYSTANSREFSHLLETFERIRRLRCGG